MTKPKWKYIFGSSKTQIIVAIIALLIVFISVFVSNAFPCIIPPVEIWFGAWLHPMLEIVTVSIAFYLWLHAKTEDWENSLPKRLTVHFKYQNKHIMTCHDAFLAGEGDIRQWSMQIGSQMTGDRNQRLALEVEIKVQKKGRIDEKYILYEATFYLQELPKSTNNLLNTNYRVWLITEKNNEPDKFVKDFEGHPNKPITKDEIKKHYLETQ